jgi:transposase
MDIVPFYQSMIAPPAPWRVGRVEVDHAGRRVDVWLGHASGSLFACPRCAAPLPVYDHTPERPWRHLDTCEYQTWLHAALPRVACPRDGTLQIKPPLSDGHSRLTLSMEKRCIETLQECSRDGAANLTGLSWDEVHRVMDRAVERGMARRSPDLPKRLGIDEKAMFKRHRYSTIITDLDQGRVIDVMDQRSVEAITPWFSEHKAALAAVEAVAMDMSAGYAKVVSEFMPQADICFDHFHVTMIVNKAVDEVRKAEQKHLEGEGERSSFFRSRYLFLYNYENIPAHRLERFEQLRRQALKTGRAWAIKENFREVWRHETVEAAETFFKKWFWWATHSRLEPMRKAAHTVRNHWQGVVNAITRGVTNACTEGLNSKIEKIKRDAFGFRSRVHLRTAILFHCGGLELNPSPA